MFYVPILPYAFYLAIKSRSFGFFSAVNPGIDGSVNGLESKCKTVQLIPQEYRPKTILLKKGITYETVLSKITAEKIEFPLIVKPDIGFRGLLVKKIASKTELSTYLGKYNSIDLLIQEYIDFKNECGIFYHRIPGEKKGKITSLTLKKYITVIGNGKSSLLELIKNNKRAKLYLALLSDLNKDKLDTIPGKNVELTLNVIGNHSKGTQFINGNHLINKNLTDLLDSINSKINDWYYGRVDIKYNNFEEFLNGENFIILEINGIISEPTHIYDASKGSYFEALKSLKEHWKIIGIIGRKNKILNQGNYTNLRYLLNLYFNFKKYLKKIKKLSAN
jgi:hypothetical protein